MAASLNPTPPLARAWSNGHPGRFRPVTETGSPAAAHGF